MKNASELADIADAATAATLPGFASLRLQLAELTEKRKAMGVTLDRLVETFGEGGAIRRYSVKRLTAEEAAAGEQRRDELQNEMAEIDTRVVDVARKISEVRPANAAAIRSALEPFRRRIDSKLLAAKTQLLEALSEWNAIETEYRQADVSNDVMPVHILKLKTIMGFLDVA
jgi:hypothetical protein